ncbi:MAG: DUF2779 domain-containing protein [Limisphaerales bacterium]
MAEGRNDPRPEFMGRLKSAIEPVGSILVFNATFEKQRLKECAELLPEYRLWVEALNGRIVDLLNPFRAFNFYHPNQCGSASMKSVLPVPTGKDYRHLEIREGGEASRELVRVTFGDVPGNHGGRGPLDPPARRSVPAFAASPGQQERANLMNR